MVDPFIMEDVTECLQAAEPRKFLDPAEKPPKKDHVFNALQKLGVAERQAYIHLHVVWCDRGIDIGFEWIYDIYRWEMVRQVLQVLKKVCKLCVNFLYSEKWLSFLWGTVELSSSVDQQPRSFTENDLISTRKFEYESEHQFLFLWKSHLTWRMIPKFRINKQIQNPTFSGSIDIGCRYFPQHICIALFFVGGRSP